MSDVPADRLESVRLEVVKRLAELMEGQTRMKIFASSVRRLGWDIHGEIIDGLRALRDAPGAPANFVEEISDAIAQCGRLDHSLVMLYDERARQWYRNGQHIQALTYEFNRIIGESSGQLIEKELLERQSRVLENVILSHEKVANWKEYVQSVLGDFNEIFAFDVFFIAFSEADRLSLYVYFASDYTAEERTAVLQVLVTRVVNNLRLPKMPVDIEEFKIGSSPRTGDIDDTLTLLTAIVPPHAPDLAGVLGVAYVSARELSSQEASIIRSILAVMMMVVGSSKVLSRTMAELEYYSVHDPLTGLYNRRHFQNILEYEIGRSERHGHNFSVLLIDFDNFKDVNDTYGHQTGDETLRRVSELLGNRVRKGDSCFRVGGDEFTVVLTETTKDGAKRVAESIRRSVSERRFFSPEGDSFHVTVSIGIVTFPEDGRQIEELLSGVDVALYHAKGIGKNEACTLEAPAKEIVAAARTTRDFAEKLRMALADNRIVPFYQPIIDCKTGQRFAHEVLMRMMEPDGEAVPAGAFITAAEKYGLSRDLDTSVLNQVIAAEHLWMLNGGDSRKFFFNLSVQDIKDHLLYAVDACRRLRIPPHNIVFEILERDAIEDIPSLRDFLERLRAQGFSFALDDFGSGYNSFHYLRELRFDYVKIDGAFVRNILDSEMNHILVRNLVNLCRDMDIRTVAEFVENSDIMNALIDMGVDYAQGYHLGKPARSIEA